MSPLDILRPTRYVAHIELIDLEELQRQGIRCILFDRDNTVVPRDTHVAPPEVMAWLERARELGMGTYMVSNNWHADRVQKSAAELGCEGISHAVKPLPFNIRRALAHMGTPPEQAVLVGDQVFTDVLGGNLSGLTTILVRPQCDKDIFGQQIIRWVEGFVNRNARYEGE